MKRSHFPHNDLKEVVFEKLGMERDQLKEYFDFFHWHEISPCENKRLGAVIEKATTPISRGHGPTFCGEEHGLSLSV